MKRKVAVILTMALMAGLMGCNKDNTDSTTEMTGNSTEVVTTSEESDTEEEQEETTTESENDVVENATESPVTIRYDLMHENYTNENGDVVLYVSYQLPIVTVNGNEAASTSIQTDFDNDKADFLLNCEQLEQEALLVFEDGVTEDMPAYASDVSFSEKRIDEKVISLVRTHYANTGGAHGNTFISGYNYDTQTGDKLTIDDIAEDKDAFMAKIKEYVLGICQSDAFKDRLMPGYEENLDFVLQDDLWYFDHEGITFIANTYELAAYAEGTLYFTIPYTELAGLKSEYAYDGGFQMSASLGETISIDLNGDGTKDELTFDAEYSDSYEYIPSLMINGADYSQVLEKNQFYFAYPYEKYVVLDMDESDCTLEIALQDYGMSDDPQTVFLQYDGNAVNYLGTINDRLSDLYLVNDGKGVLRARERMSVFETAMIQVSYKLENGSLVADMKNLFPVIYYSMGGVGSQKTLLQDFVVYEEMNTQSNQITLTKDSVVYVLATDNAEWMQIKDTDGTVYYVHLINGFNVDVNGEEVFTGNVFDELFMAG